MGEKHILNNHAVGLGRSPAVVNQHALIGESAGVEIEVECRHSPSDRIVEVH